jgi:hypothetical protein
LLPSSGALDKRFSSEATLGSGKTNEKKIAKCDNTSKLKAEEKGKEGKKLMKNIF